MVLLVGNNYVHGRVKLNIWNAVENCLVFYGNIWCRNQEFHVRTFVRIYRFELGSVITLERVLFRFYLYVKVVSQLNSWFLNTRYLHGSSIRERE